MGQGRGLALFGRPRYHGQARGPVRDLRGCRALKVPMATRHPPELIERALIMAAEGQASTAIAEACGVGTSTVVRWCKRFGVALAYAHGPDNPEPDPQPDTAPPVAALPPGPEGEDEGPDLDDPLPEGTTSLEDARLLQREAWAISRAARRAGNHTAAQRAHRDAMAATGVIARLERWQVEAGDTLRISRGDLARAVGTLRAKAQVMASRPLLCAHCHRALMVAWGTAPHVGGGPPGSQDAPAEAIPGGSVVPDKPSP